MRFWLGIAALLLAGCAGPSTDEKAKLARLEDRGDFAAAADRIQAEKADYGPSNEVLYDLDLGQALADAGRREEADAHFAAAQDRMIQLWTLSASKLAGAAFANENVDDYRGEDFDRALSHVLRGVNLLALDRRRDALIEAERAEDFLDQLRREAPRSRAYRDDAFARWFAARLYEDLGQSDDARISGEAADRAYARYEKTYGTLPPRPPAGSGDAELVVLQLEGVVPHKVRRSVAGPLGVLLEASYPAYAPGSGDVARCEVAVGTMVVEARVAEDIQTIAEKSLAERLLFLKARSTMRAAVKLAGTVTGVNAVDSEFADVRGWSTLPARIRVASLRLPAGRARVSVRCEDSAGRQLESRDSEIDATPGARVWLVDRAL